MQYVGGPKASAGHAQRRPAASRHGARPKPARGRRAVGEECLFCRVAASRNERENLVLTRRPHALLMLNRYPYNPAHLMVAVVRHVPRFAELSPDERSD